MITNHPLIYRLAVRNQRKAVSGQVRKTCRRQKPEVAPTIPAVRDYLRGIEAAFLAKLESELGREVLKTSDSKWRMCGPAARALAWILSFKTGLPIGLGLFRDHLELQYNLFDPPGEPHRAEDHVSLRFFCGRKRAFIDPIYGPLFCNDPALRFAVYGRNIDWALARDLHLGPIDPRDKRVAELRDYKPAKGDPKKIMALSRAIVNRENTEWALSVNAPPMLLPWDIVYRYLPDAPAVRRIISEFVPDVDWSVPAFKPLIENEEAALAELRSQVQTYEMDSPTDLSFWTLPVLRGRKKVVG